MLSDMKRAHFAAKAQREWCVELPPEDVGFQEVYLALHGTRDAASLWQESLAQHLAEIGFVRGRSNPFVSFMRIVSFVLSSTVMITRLWGGGRSSYFCPR